MQNSFATAAGRNRTRTGSCGSFPARGPVGHRRRPTASLVRGSKGQVAVFGVPNFVLAQAVRVVQKQSHGTQSIHPIRPPPQPPTSGGNLRQLARNAQPGAAHHPGAGPYTEAIARYLDYCHRNGVSVTCESARGFMADALRRRLTDQENLWEAGLNWFFEEGRKRGAPHPQGVPTPGRADTGRTPWESRMIERLRLGRVG